MSRLLGKVAIVTGGASGIGAETARVFARHGAKVLLTDSNASLGQSVAREISESGGTAMFSAQDVRDEAMWATIVAQAEKSFGRLDILCNIAGISDKTGRILGMMPHPERLYELALGGTDGRRVFESVVVSMADAA